jgi:hypothetical protein
MVKKHGVMISKPLRQTGAAFAVRNASAPVRLHGSGCSSMMMGEGIESYDSR